MHAHGLLATQTAATKWASGAVDVDLLGLVLVADAPGRLSRPLRDLARLVSGGLPRVWNLPWIEAWRLGEPPSLRSEERRVGKEWRSGGCRYAVSRKKVHAQVTRG